MATDDNVVRLFYDEADLEQAWLRFDAAMIRLHALYASPDGSTEAERRLAATVAAEAEIEFRAVFARTRKPQLVMQG